MTERRIDTKAVLEKYRKWAEVGGFMHQTFNHGAALLDVWYALAQEIADREAERKRAQKRYEELEQDFNTMRQAKQARVEALERGDVVMRLLLQRLLCDCEPRALDDVALTTVPGTHDFGCAYRQEMQPVLAALAAKEKIL